VEAMLRVAWWLGGVYPRARGGATQNRAKVDWVYKQADAGGRAELSVKDASFYSKAGYPQYAKRQMTGFRQEPGLEVVRGFGDDGKWRRGCGRGVGEFL